MFGQVALVELQDVRNGGEIEIVIAQMLAQIIERFEVRVQPLFLRIRDENYAVGTLQNQSPARFVENLAGNGVKMKARLESAHGAEIEGQKVEEKGAIRLRRQRNHLPFLIRSRVLVNPLQIGGLPAKAGAVINQLAVDFACRKIDKRHDFLRNSLARYL